MPETIIEKRNLEKALVQVERNNPLILFMTPHRNKGCCLSARYTRLMVALNQKLPLNLNLFKGSFYNLSGRRLQYPRQ